MCHITIDFTCLLSIVISSAHCKIIDSMIAYGSRRGIQSSRCKSYYMHIEVGMMRTTTCTHKTIVNHDSDLRLDCARSRMSEEHTSWSVKPLSTLLPRHILTIRNICWCSPSGRIDESQGMLKSHRNELLCPLSSGALDMISRLVTMKCTKRNGIQITHVFSVLGYDRMWVGLMACDLSHELGASGAVHFDDGGAA